MEVAENVGTAMRMFDSLREVNGRGRQVKNRLLLFVFLVCLNQTGELATAIENHDAERDEAIHCCCSSLSHPHSAACRSLPLLRKALVASCSEPSTVPQEPCQPGLRGTPVS